MINSPLAEGGFDELAKRRPQTCIASTPCYLLVSTVEHLALNIVLHLGFAAA